jgi:glutathione synthase
MDLLLVADPIASFKTYKDSTFAMMREAASRGHELWACEPQQLVWQRGSLVQAQARRITLTGDAQDWYDEQEQALIALSSMDAVLMRKDPPFDAEYLYATHLLTQAEREGARVFNKPQALREHPEKLAILEFPLHIAPTLVTRSIEAVRAFHAEHRDIILKPLDGMGGAGIFRVKDDGLNLGSIAETLHARRRANHHGAGLLAGHQRRRQARAGDRRRARALYALARIPQGGEVRGNLAAGGKGVAQPLSESDWAIARELGPILASRGLLLVGLDIIGNRLDRDQCDQPDLLPGNHRPDRLRRGRALHRRAAAPGGSRRRGRPALTG